MKTHFRALRAAAYSSDSPQGVLGFFVSTEIEHDGSRLLVDLLPESNPLRARRSAKAAVKIAELEGERAEWLADLEKFLAERIAPRPGGGLRRYDVVRAFLDHRAASALKLPKQPKVFAAADAFVWLRFQRQPCHDIRSPAGGWCRGWHGLDWAPLAPPPAPRIGADAREGGARMADASRGEVQGAPV